MSVSGTDGAVKAAYPAVKTQPMARPASSEPKEVATPLAAQELLDAPLPKDELVVDDLFLLGGVAALVAEPGIGKSALLVDLIIAVASGQEWLGRQVRPFNVVVVPAEGRLAAWRGRLVAAAKKRGLDFAELPVTVLVHQLGTGSHYIRPLDLTKADSAALDRVAAGLRPGLIVLDPLSDTHSGDENQVHQIRPLLSYYRRLAGQTGALVVIAHHARKPPVAREGVRPDERPSQHDARGSSAIVGAMDTVLSLHRVGDAVEVSVTKQRDLPTPKGPAGAFRVVTFEGAPVVEYVDPAEARNAALAQRAAEKTAEAAVEIEAILLAALERLGGQAVLSDLVDQVPRRKQEARKAISRLEAVGRLRGLDGTRPDAQGRHHPCRLVSLVQPAREVPANPGINSEGPGGIEARSIRERRSHV